MKHAFKIFALIGALQIFSCYGLMTTAKILHDVITGSVTKRSNLYIISDTQNYTIGGLTFTYPVGIFTLPPVVQISVQPNASHPADETYVAEISANDATATTVMVYLISTTAGVVSVAEAPNSSVMINLLAIADPA